MANASIGGLVSGMDTATIISQLMRLEALPQAGLKSKVSSAQTRVNALQTLNSKLASVATRAADLAKLSGWTPTKATSSVDTVTAKTSSTATPGSVTFQALSVAKAKQASYTTTATPEAIVVPANSPLKITYDDGRTSVSVNSGDGSLAAVAEALNASGTGLRAKLVKVDDTKYRLHVESTTTGATSGFAITESDGTTPILGGVYASTVGTDAQIKVSGETTNLTSKTNTFTGLMPGVDVTLGPTTVLNADVTVTVTRDTTSLAGSVKAMVDAVNLALDDIKSLTSSDPAAKKAGLLTGDSGLRRIRNDLLASVTSGVDGTSLATVGIQVDKTGRLVFDQTKFTDAYTADPTGVAAKFAGTGTWSDSATAVKLSGATWRTQPGGYAVVADGTGGTIGGYAATLSGSILNGAKDTPVEGLSLSYTGTVNGTFTYKQGFAAKLEALAQRASDATQGTVSASVKGRTSEIDRMNDEIAAWDVRLGSRRQTLERQYAALEVALGKMQNQSSWLASQIAGLPKMMSGN